MWSLRVAQKVDDVLFSREPDFLYRLLSPDIEVAGTTVVVPSTNVKCTPDSIFRKGVRKIVRSFRCRIGAGQEERGSRLDGLR